MSEYIALDWEQSRLNGLEASTARGRVRVGRCFQLEWPAPDGDAADESARMGEWLKGELERLGVEARKVLVSLPREQVVVRQIEVPDVPAEELPELVRLQAETRLSTSIDDLVLDFLPLPQLPEEAARSVLLFTLPRERLDRIGQIVAAAGLELEQVGVSSAATAELVARVEESRRTGDGETTLTVARHGKRVEITLMRQRHLLFAHSTQLTGDDDAQDSRLASAEIRRSLGAHSRTEADMRVARAWAIGTDRENELFRGSVAQQLDCEVGGIDPLANDLVTFAAAGRGSSLDAIESHAPYGGPVGLLLAVEEPMAAGVDFLHPRRAVVRHDRRNLNIAAVAASIALVVAGLYGITRWRAAGLENEIEAARDQLVQFDERIKKGRPIVQAAGAVDDWRAHRLDWLDGMGQLNGALPGTDRIYLTNLRSTPASGGLAGRVRADGAARSDADVNALQQRFSEKGYEVQPQAIPRDSEDKDYPYTLQLDVAVPIESAATNR